MTTHILHWKIDQVRSNLKEQIQVGDQIIFEDDDYGLPDKVVAVKDPKNGFTYTIIICGSDNALSDFEVLI